MITSICVNGIIIIQIIVTWRLKAGMVEPEQTSIGEQWVRIHVSVTRNKSERDVAR
jgi:hypothetical protein